MFRSQLGILICLLLWHTSATLQQDESNPIVDTKLGKIQGTTLTSQYGSTIYAFRGIPYAQPPINNLRFVAPQPISAWNGTLNASTDSLICPQFRGPINGMSEDCLKLNVFSRNLTGNAPVMVWIHGGANIGGSGHSMFEAGPQYLLDHDVVFVPFNYRLGAFGFLSTRSREAPGNFGYLDQVLVLKWVRDHIANFGGNPNLVTIFGISAGAQSVTLHMASPLSKGLFHRAISMSGSATHFYPNQNLHWTRKLARETSCPMCNPKDVIDCLRKVSWEKIIELCSKWEPYGVVGAKFVFEIDGNFLEDYPTEVFRKGKSNSVPLLIGITKNELDFQMYSHENDTGLLNDISVNFDQYAPEAFRYDVSAELRNPPASRRIQKFYLGDSGKVTSDNLIRFGEIMSDVLAFPVQRLVDLLGSKTKVYYYRMDYQAHSFSLYPDANGLPRGVGHGDDMQYLMPGTKYAPQFPLDHPDMFMVDRLTKWWTTFAKNGNPYTKDYQGPWTTADKGMIYINRTTLLAPAPYAKRFAFWERLFPLKESSGPLFAGYYTHHCGLDLPMKGEAIRCVHHQDVSTILLTLPNYLQHKFCV